LPQNPAKPLLLVDVDGVISLFGPGLDVGSGGRWITVDGIAHFLSERVGDHLRALAESFDLVWCTGWEERANDHLPRELGFPGPLPTIFFAERPEHLAHWKLGGIEAFAGPDRALAWIDDSHDDACHAWAAERPGPTLLVAVKPDRGLTAAEADDLRAWAERCRRGSEGRRTRTPGSSL